ncbi:MAG: NAD(P)-binding domain-containing protein [Anaerolineales bacterium]|nr:NAD(P)-binding domain-containing protein [Anaerolineales bacterium]
MQHIPTLILGGGQAGLSSSYFLKQQNHEHLILEKAAHPAHAWRNDRWDSFALLTPNWTVQLPGAPYDGDDRDGFLSREAIITYLETYAARFHLPVQYNTPALAVEPLPEGGFHVSTPEALYHAQNVIIATGTFQTPQIPAFAQNLASSITQLHSGQYRNPEALPPGAVLIVGSGQSGCQIAEELYQAGRKVYLAVGKTGRVPRRYRGKDTFEWLHLLGFFDRTVDQLPSPMARFGSNPHLSGKNGGHSLNLHQFVRDGVTLLGHFTGAEGNSLTFAPDKNQSLTQSDQFEANIVNMIDGFIQKSGLDAPSETLPHLEDGYALPDIEHLDSLEAKITSIIWANGYKFDYRLVKADLFEPTGYPIQTRGVTAIPGLYFVGLNWLHKYKSTLFVGVGEDAEYIANHVLARAKSEQKMNIA